MNFLWFSDIALLTTGAALWLESPLLARMMALAIALPELAWNIDFFVRPQTILPAPLYVVLVLLMFSLGVYLPTRLLFERIFG